MRERESKEQKEKAQKGKTEGEELQRRTQNKTKQKTPREGHGAEGPKGKMRKDIKQETG